MFDLLNGDARCGVGYVDRDLPVTKRTIGVKTPKATQRSKPPLLLAAAWHREVSRVKRLPFVQPGNRSRLNGPLQACHQPTAPSICSSISRLSSSAYSIGSSRAI